MDPWGTQAANQDNYQCAANNWVKPWRYICQCSCFAEEEEKKLITIVPQAEKQNDKDDFSLLPLPSLLISYTPPLIYDR